MTNKKQPEALRLADELEEPLHDFPEPTTLEAEAASELRRLHAENQALRAGYAAARLEIESLRKEHADELAVAYMCGASREKELAAQQPGVAYAALPEPDLVSKQRDSTMRYTTVRSFSESQMRAFADATCALRASHGQAPAGWTDADADAARLALELECLLMDTKDAAVVSKWWASANDALELHRTRLKDMRSPAAQSDRLLQLADELDEQLTSGAKWSPAQHACCNVSTALRDIAQSALRPHHGQAPAQAAPAAVAGPNEAVKFTDQSTADPVEKARRYLTAMGDQRTNSAYFYDDGYPRRESAQDALATLAVLEQLAAAPTTQPAPQLPERDASVPAEQQGLFRKFDVRRVDGTDKPGGKHHGCTYFVLDVDHDPCARPALAAYAAACEATHPALAADLLTKWGAVPTTQPAPNEDEGISREQWIEQAMRVYLIAGDTEQHAEECAKYLWGELDLDDLADPYDAAMSDVEGRGPAPQPSPAAQGDALDAACQRACMELPEGMSMAIQLERDAGWIELHVSYGDQIELPNADGSLAEQVHQAIDAARAAQEGKQP